MGMGPGKRPYLQTAHWPLSKRTNVGFVQPKRNRESCAAAVHTSSRCRLQSEFWPTGKRSHYPSNGVI